ncbi:uncharacterized protein BT62DRAFT_935525 [Guyanagaster necrorhizus]|uniref:Uncharacterized protein n=1 Tax=Guyanagaster necrorhizus TaxID=856835 RepID=A0A9P7VLA4_9AGAR|nr:uncharacterized protein BT62DRAFT_935525 [Guyanagaster necrorhizus MCA 3950]KAG7442794.1 hypothetical protein BT62DRAFT_935525 [Guyanagaster necrorhizus MCA 3950]
MSSSNPIVPLEPNSLYIATNQLINHLARFHWAFYKTDENGKATTYEWTELPPRSDRFEGVTVTNYTKKLSVIFAFMKVKGMKTMLDQEKMAMQVFTGPNRLGFTSLLENR